MSGYQVVEDTRGVEVGEVYQVREDWGQARSEAMSGRLLVV